MLTQGLFEKPSQRNPRFQKPHGPDGHGGRATSRNLPYCNILFVFGPWALLPILQPSIAHFCLVFGKQHSRSLITSYELIMPSTLYMLYNADASWMGKLHYGYRKLTAPKDKPACAACDITHGGLRLDETAEWQKAKEEIAQSQELEIRQLHRDEMGADVCLPCNKRYSQNIAALLQISADYWPASDQAFRGSSELALSHGLVQQ